MDLMQMAVYNNAALANQFFPAALLENHRRRSRDLIL